MPTSIWGVAFYVFALFPGVAFVFAREGHHASSKRSALRETASVVFVSAVCDAAVALVVVAVAVAVPEVAKVITAMLDGDLSWARTNFGWALVYTLLALTAATLLGFFLGSKWAHDHGMKLFWSAAIPRDVSAWQKILYPEERLEVKVGLTLKSGAWVSGTLWDFDNDADNSPHRTITLSGELSARSGGSEEPVPLTETDWVVVEAGDIELLQASYYRPADDADPGTPDAGIPNWRKWKRAGLGALVVGAVSGLVASLSPSPSLWIRIVTVAAVAASALFGILAARRRS